MTDEGRYLYSGPCEECGSSDAKAHYSTGTAYCFSCEAFFPNADTEGGAKKAKPMGPLLQRLMYRDLRARKISEETCRKFGYGLSTYKGETVQVAPYYRNGELVAQNLRTANKEFIWLGDYSTKIDLFGQHLWGSGGKRIVVTEGVIDCLTVAQAFGLRWPVVSVPNGAQSAKKHLQHHLEYLESFDEVVLAFDNDEPGRKAVEECAPLFSPGKVKILNWSPYKDANEMLQSEPPSKIVDYVYQAQTYRPDGIISSSEITLEYLLKDDNLLSFSLPYPLMDGMLKGLRKAEITTFGAGTGIGKSTIVRELAFHLATQHQQKIGYIALEESVKKSVLGFLAMDLGVPMGDLFLDRSLVSREALEDARKRLLSSDRFYFYDHFGSLESDNLVSKIRYLASGLGVDFIVLDHLSIVVSGIEDGDERRIIDNLMTSLRSLVENTGVGMLLVSHLRVPQGTKAHEEGGRVTLNEFRGSGAIKQLSDNIIGIERDQQGENSNISTLRVLKNRLFGVTGVADRLQWNHETGRLLPLEEEDVPNEFLDDETEADLDDVPF